MQYRRIFLNVYIGKATPFPPPLLWPLRNCLNASPLYILERQANKIPLKFNSLHRQQLFYPYSYYKSSAWLGMATLKHLAVK